MIRRALFSELERIYIYKLVRRNPHNGGFATENKSDERGNDRMKESRNFINLSLKAKIESVCID